MSSAADWVSAASAAVTTIIAGVAAWVGLWTFRNQRTASDVGLALSIFGEINRYWDRLSANSAEYDYNMGQILAQFEIAAGLFNRGVLTSDAEAILADHIVEVFSQIMSSSSGEELLKRCCSATTTFQELQNFIRKKMPQALNSLEFRNHHK